MMTVQNENRLSSYLGKLVTQVKPVATWGDIAVPEAELRVLQQIAAHGRQSQQVSKSSPSGSAGGPASGVVALFAGPSGTSKTMAAEALAQQMKRQLYRVNLREVVSKYIGETEKNLQRVFDAAKASGAVLFFDEADGLFGNRSEVKDSHDRYANIEVNYLLEKVEAFRGVVIVAVNNASDIDSTFRKRMRHVIQFPYPLGK